MQDQIPVSADALVPEHVQAGVREVANDVAYIQTGIVNVVMCGPAGAGPGRWILVDAGLRGFTQRIRNAARSRYAPESDKNSDPRPDAIVLTHGHFDHVGCLLELADAWQVPVYAHTLEAPFLDGTRSYPPPNPWAGGMMSLTSPLLPRGPIDVRPRLRTLPEDGSIPGMPEWRWLHTPGHTPGHVSLWRESDRLLIAGDAFITTRQESLIDAISQRPQIHGPPRYFTPDWDSARESVRFLASLEPRLVVTGHGRAMQGQVMRSALHRLADQFDEIAVPHRGVSRRGRRVQMEGS